MLELKKRQLEARGWKLGTTEEFLDLTAEESSYIELKLKLAASLRRRRNRRHLTQEGLAKLVRSSQSRVAKLETGDPSVSVDLLIRALLALGASNREIAGAIAPTRKATSS